MCTEGTFAAKTETLCSALCQHEGKRSVVRWGRNLMPGLGKEMDSGAARCGMRMGTASLCPGWCCVGFLRGLRCPLATAAAEPPPVPVPHRSQDGARPGLEVPEISTGAASTFCTWQQFCSSADSCGRAAGTFRILALVKNVYI